MPLWRPDPTFDYLPRRRRVLGGAATGGQTFEIGQVVETEVAQPVTARKVITAAQPAETEVAQPVTARFVVPVGQALETELAQPVMARKQAAVAQTTETELAQPVVARFVVPIGQAVETELAQPVTARFVVPIGQATETELALPVSAPIVVIIGQAVEAELAQPVTARKVVGLGQPAETELAQVVTARKLVALGQAVETELAQPVTVVGQAVSAWVVGMVPILAVPRCSGPITISSGGVYQGCYESLNPSVPAVTLATTQPVTLLRATIRHAGFGLFAQSTVNTDITVQNSIFKGLDPGSALEARAVYLLQPADVLFEHNLLEDGQGLLINGNDTTATIVIRYNDYLDIGRWDSNTLIGAVHFDQVLAPDALVAWNRIRNHYGRSVTEDVIGIHESSGTSGHPIVIEHNLIDGSYPHSGNGSGFTGGGIDLGDGDAGGSYQVSRYNTVLRVTNNGLMIPGGDHLEHHDNVAITSGKADDGTRVSSTFGNGLNLWDNPGYSNTPSVVSIHHTTGDHRRWTGSAWERSWQNTPACDPSSACDIQTLLNLTLTDDAAWLTAINDALDDWEAERVAAGVTIGPLP